jgi:hypothetical protein
MFKSPVFLTALCFAINFADKNVKIVTIKQLNSGRTGSPYDLDITVTVDDSATLEVAMKKAEKEYNKFT